MIKIATLLGLAFLVNSPIYAADVLDEPIRPITIPDITDPQMVDLGHKLFHEMRLSLNGTISCASCHSLSTAGMDGLVESIGVNGQLGGINTPTVFNSRLNFRQMWDGRAFNLMEQVEKPILNPKEMGSNWAHILNFLQNDPPYLKLFSRTFSDGLTQNNVKKALVAFEETLLTPNSRFDRYLMGEADAITVDELMGYSLFKEYGCISCHQGMAVGGNLFQKLGLMKDYFSDRGNITTADLGRFNVTQKEKDRHVFKVPSLRNIELTAPYFHDGSINTLDSAVRVMMVYQLGIKPIETDIQLIVKFLRTLTGEYQGVPLNNE